MKNLESMYKLELMKMPKHVKEMPWIEYCQEQGGQENVLNLSNAINNVLEDSICSKVDNQVSQLKSAMKTAKKRGRAASAKENGPGTAVRQSARKRNASEDRGSTISRTSSRSRTRGLVDTTNMETPARSGAPQMMVGMTPMITPKCDTRSEHLLRTVTRGAKNNEVLFSLSGSPVAPVSNRTKVGKQYATTHAQVPIGDGQTLNLPLNEDFDLNPATMDEATLKQLKEFTARLQTSVNAMSKVKVSQ